MVIDTSALLAILFEEEEALAFFSAITATRVRLLSAATYVEASLVITRRRSLDGLTAFDNLLRQLRIEVILFDKSQAVLAREAFRRFGKGQHKAGLNFGDCFRYALAKHRGQPLLYKGHDFRHTDLISA